MHKGFNVVLEFLSVIACLVSVGMAASGIGNLQWFISWLIVAAICLVPFIIINRKEY